jgi:hypothetical protein
MPENVTLFDPATIAPCKRGERPAVPMWSHQAGKWAFDGKLYDDPQQAEHLYTNALLDYVDFLESKVKALEGRDNV